MALHQYPIEWSRVSWNPVTGCSKISPGCDHCYAERMAKRLHGYGMEKYRNGFEVTLHPDKLELPLKWKKPTLIFVNSMSDIFHDEVPLEYIQRIFDVAKRADRHIFQMLTKRSKRLARVASKLDWPHNVWMGITCESQTYTYRIDDLRKVPATVRFLSLEPLLGPLRGLNLQDIHWAIVGGESGPGARPMQEAWVLEIQQQCKAQKTAFFFKQWGGVNKKAAGRLLRGKLHEDMPEVPQRAAIQPRLELE